MRKPIPVFISYAHEDASFLDELKKCLVTFERKKEIAVWADHIILAGEKWDTQIKQKLEESEIIVFLVSQDFLASDYINNVEIKNAIENKKLIIIPLIIRPIEMSQLPLNSLQVIPSGGKAVTKWDNRDDAWVDVTKALSRVFDKINDKQRNSPQNVLESTSVKPYSNTLKREKASDNFVLVIIIILLSISIVMFGYGLFRLSIFHICASLPGIGLGLTGYLICRKSFAT
jgi:sulfur transfer complex TusBCD TusB component (DsrH family)